MRTLLEILRDLDFQDTNEFSTDLDTPKYFIGFQIKLRHTSKSEKVRPGEKVRHMEQKLTSI